MLYYVIIGLSPACVGTVEDTLAAICQMRPNGMKGVKMVRQKGTQHDTGYFDIALELARYVVKPLHLVQNA